MPRRKQVFRLIGVAVAAVSLLSIGKQLYDAWPQLAQLSIQPTLALLALVFGTTTLVLYAVLWRNTLERLGGRLPTQSAIRIWFSAQIVRYVPGNVWHLLGRAYLAQQEGVSVQTVSVSMVLELIQSIAGALLIALASLVFWPELNAFALWTVLLAPLIVFYCWPQGLQVPFTWVLQRIGRQPVSLGVDRRDLLALLPGYCLTWVLYGCGLFLLARSIYPLALSALPAVTGIFAIAWVVGFLSFITPSGLGVREGVLSYLLSMLMPTPVALLLALLARVWLTVAELGCAAFVVWRRR